MKGRRAAPEWAPNSATRRYAGGPGTIGWPDAGPPVSAGPVGASLLTTKGASRFSE